MLQAFLDKRQMPGVKGAHCRHKGHTVAGAFPAFHGGGQCRRGSNDR
jgi:hypothetical protein